MMGNNILDSGFGGFPSNPYSTILGAADVPKIAITKLLLFTTRTDYQAPYQRTYSIDATTGTLNKLEHIISERGKNSYFQPIAAASNIPEIINIQAMPSGMANIVNGWNQERLRFIMVVECDGMTGTKRISYVQGYTEFSEVTQSGLIDPNMVFYINSVTNVTTTIDRVNNRLHTVPSATFNVVTDAFGGRHYEIGDPFDLPKLVRPVDIVENSMSIEMHNGSQGRVINASGALGEFAARATARTNNDPLMYFSKLYNGFIDGKNSAVYSNNPVDVLNNAADSGPIREYNLLDQPLIANLHKLTGETTPSSFTLQMLMMLDPNINLADIVVIKRDYTQPSMKSHMDANVLNMMMFSNDTMNTLNPTAENLKAVTICNSINSMMLDCLITRASISMSNSTGENVVIISDVNSFIPDVDLVMWCNKLYSRLNCIVMPKITDGGLTRIDVHFITDTVSDTTISISVNGGPMYLYRFPTFADSLYLPTVTNTENKALLTESFQNLADVTYL